MDVCSNSVGFFSLIWPGFQLLHKMLFSNQDISSVLSAIVESIRIFSTSQQIYMLFGFINLFYNLSKRLVYYGVNLFHFIFFVMYLIFSLPFIYRFYLLFPSINLYKSTMSSHGKIFFSRYFGKKSHVFRFRREKKVGNTFSFILSSFLFVLCHYIHIFKYRCIEKN